MAAGASLPALPCCAVALLLGCSAALLPRFLLCRAAAVHSTRDACETPWPRKEVPPWPRKEMTPWPRKAGTSRVECRNIVEGSGRSNTISQERDDSKK